MSTYSYFDLNRHQPLAYQSMPVESGSNKNTNGPIPSLGFDLNKRPSISLNSDIGYYIGPSPSPSKSRKQIHMKSRNRKQKIMKSKSKNTEPTDDEETESFDTYTDTQLLADYMANQRNESRYRLPVKYTGKSNRDYVHSVREAAIIDSQNIQNHQNMTLMLSAAAGVSLVLFGYMYTSSSQ